MKPILFDFEYFSKGKVTINTAIVTFVKDRPGAECSVIKNIGFKEPVSNISYAQLLDLTKQIEKAVINQTENDANLERALAVGKNLPSDKSIGGLRGLAEKMVLGMEKRGEFSQDEKQKVSKAFELLDFFLGPRK